MNSRLSFLFVCKQTHAFQFIFSNPTLSGLVMATVFRPSFSGNASFPPPPTAGPRPGFVRPNSFYVFQPRPINSQNPLQNADFDGKRMVRKNMARKTVDYNSSVAKMLKARVYQRDYRDARALQPHVSYYTEVCFLNNLFFLNNKSFYSFSLCLQCL